MKHAVTTILVTTTYVLLLSTTNASAGELGTGHGIPQPTLLRITGFVAQAPEGAATLGTVTLGVDHKVTTLHLTDVQTLSGALTEGPAALRQFDLYNPNLLLVGDRGLLRDINDASPQAKLTVFGYVVPGTQRLVVVDVQGA